MRRVRIILTTLPERKPNRLKEYDYSTPGAYFITICVKDRLPMLSTIPVGATIGRPIKPVLKKHDIIVEKAIKKIPKHYPTVSVDSYVIMPDHVHLLLQIHSEVGGRPLVAPTIERVIKQTKGAITKQIGFSIWQKSFYDHIIRNENDYRDIWEYIVNNPIKQ